MIWVVGGESLCLRFASEELCRKACTFLMVRMYRGKGTEQLGTSGTAEKVVVGT